MPLNDLRLRFGPAPDDPSSAVGLAFIATPAMSPDLAVSAFSTHRFAKENHPQLRSYYWNTGRREPRFRVRHEFAGSSVLGQASAEGAWSLSEPGRRIDIEGSSYGFDLVDSPILSEGLYKTASGSWALSVRPGVVFRSYTVPDYEQPDVWFMSGALSGLVEAGTQCILAYAVPEASYGPLEESPDARFPGAGRLLRRIVEQTSPSAPNKVSFTGDIHTLTEVRVNGVVRFTGEFSEESADSGPIKELDRALKTIELRYTMAPTDDVVLEYLEYPQSYRYLGYRDREGVFYPFDANPEYGHAIGDQRYGALRSSSECLLEQATVYALPSAIGLYRIEESPGQDPEIVVTWHSAYDYGETHFVRHIVGTPEEDISPRVSEGPSNTYGFAVFGRNYYDDSGLPRRDVFSTQVPSMLPISRVLLKAPASVEAVSLADARLRGGGVPEDVDFSLVAQEPGALTTLKGFFDLGNWDGMPVKKGGVVRFAVTSQVLVQNGGRFTEAEVRDIAMKRIPPGVDLILEFV